MGDLNVRFGNLEGTEKKATSKLSQALAETKGTDFDKKRAKLKGVDYVTLNVVDLSKFVPSAKNKEFNLISSVKKIIEGDLNEFNKIDNRFRADLLGIAKNRLNEQNKSYAKDVTQNSLGKLFLEIIEGRITEESNESRIESVLFGSIGYEVLNVQHSGNKNSFEYKTRPINNENNEIETFESCITELNVFDDILNSEIKSELRGAINRLPKKFRHILKLRFYFQMNHKEISEVLKLEHTLVRNRFIHAVKNLKREFR